MMRMLGAAVAMLAVGMVGPVASAAAAPGEGPDEVEMVLVPAGEFLMGSDAPDAAADEQPVSKVILGAFWIDKLEVTNARYARCVEAGACSPPATRLYSDPMKGDLPASLVSWVQAVAYCRWVGKRLPSEAEWEKAARGPDGREHPWGNTFPADRANAGYARGPLPVGGYLAGAAPYGTLDMSNVWEWTSSLYRPYPYDPKDGREDLTARGARVNRGGSWYHGAWYKRTTYRATADQMYRRVADLGFRCARS